MQVYDPMKEISYAYHYILYRIYLAKALKILLILDCKLYISHIVTCGPLKKYYLIRTINYICMITSIMYIGHSMPA